MSIASRIASAAKVGGTYIAVALAPVLTLASSTVLNIVRCELPPHLASPCLPYLFHKLWLALSGNFLGFSQTLTNNLCIFIH